MLLVYLALLFTLLLETSGLPVNADEDLRLPRVVVATGGPYQARSNSIQNYDDAIIIPSEYLRQPLSMVCSNGSQIEAGFNWVRLFLLPDKSDADLQSLAEPVGRLLIDENSFLASAQVYLDMTGQFRPGRNNIRVEAAGRPGSVFSFEIRSIGKPNLFMPDSIRTFSGAWLDIYGNGFSLRPEENTVQLGAVQLPVAESSQSQLKVFVPKNFPAGTYDLSAAIRSYRSRTIKVEVVEAKAQ